ncbi:MAG: methylmalonyl-CoA epimerase [Bdellovibrionales bacterium GWA2_49_15]|nr:MAG: methylmalonyl-CoA epimerase [Bdellovibrionales bacterium GWA2_49_15]HAZ11800.1 methylmalonyl-CoA epimerase [Bdellovibrionales bacterium]
MTKDALLDHIAIAVQSLNVGRKVYEDMGLLFAPKSEVVASEGVETLFAPIDQQAHLELISPYGENGPLHKFLEKNGPGIHHLCFCVTDLEKKCADLRSKGYQLIYDHPRIGARGMKVNFVHPKSSDGVLIELVQKG